MSKGLKITNPDKILFPDNKITKLDVVNYYMDISSQMLPYVKNRLLSVIRCHEGIEGECFFKKHPVSDKFVQVYQDGNEEYFYIKNKTELVYQAQMGSVEIHTWASRLPHIDKPNMMIFDLDPDEHVTLNALRKAVLKVKDLLDELDLTSFIKTSGGKGYHVVVPFTDCKDWDSFYEFSKLIAVILEKKWPKIFTTNIRKSERKDKIFIDYLRNNRGSTCVAPYSVRARKTAPISMPISWENLTKIKPNEVNIRNYKKYISNAWDNFHKVKQSIK